MRYHTHQQFDVDKYRPKSERELAVECPRCGETLSQSHLKSMYGGCTAASWTGVKLECRQCHSVINVTFK